MKKTTSSPRKGHNEFIARRASRSEGERQDALPRPIPPTEAAPINRPPRRQVMEDAEGFQSVVFRRSPRQLTPDGARDSEPEVPAKRIKAAHAASRPLSVSV